MIEKLKKESVQIIIVIIIIIFMYTWFQNIGHYKYK